MSILTITGHPLSIQLNMPGWFFLYTKMSSIIIREIQILFGVLGKVNNACYDENSTEFFFLLVETIIFHEEFQL